MQFASPSQRLPRGAGFNRLLTDRWEERKVVLGCTFPKSPDSSFGDPRRKRNDLRARLWGGNLRGSLGEILLFGSQLPGTQLA